MKSKIIILVLIAIIVLGSVFFLPRGKSYNVRITIPAGYSEEFAYSDEEISPKKGKITITAVEGIGDCEVVLKPIEAKEEKLYVPTYMTHGLTVKMDAEKGAWYKVGVSNAQSPDGKDIDVYVTVSDVDLRIQ